MVWQDYPVWGLCLYDSRVTPTEVIDVVERTHPRIVTGTGRRRMNDRYEDPAMFVHAPAEPDPLEASPPAVDLVGATPAEARRALRRVATGSLDRETLEGLVLGVSETVTNGYVHGSAPVTLRIWTTTDHVVVTVHDTGTGPDDPFAGLRSTAVDPRGIGKGLWLAHQLCTDVELSTTSSGFKVRFRATSSSSAL